ncbi:MAG: UbiX family flavin prenyltransferase [Alphaproteobacteria bacterium]|nr:UbiX family flavin prenyltransferase [Alphaproteobacteria bacterium]
MATKRLMLAFSGGSGAIYGIRGLEALRRTGEIETHVIVTRAGARMLAAETGHTPRDLTRLADIVHDASRRKPPPFPAPLDTLGLLVAPCSPQSLRAVADEDKGDLVARTAASCLARHRRVVLLLTEARLEPVTIQLMAKATRLGAVITLPVPAFYHRPSSLDDIIDQTVGRALDLFDVEAGLVRRWTEDDRPGP